jgi:hypothetical protein
MVGVYLDGKGDYNMCLECYEHHEYCTNCKNIQLQGVSLMTWEDYKSMSNTHFKNYQSFADNEDLELGGCFFQSEIEDEILNEILNENQYESDDSFSIDILEEDMICEQDAYDEYMESRYMR